MAGLCIMLMGLSGPGKSSVGTALASALQAEFIDGDDRHPWQNIVKMSSGQTLHDDDRLPWPGRLSDAIFSLEQKNESGSLACSALGTIVTNRVSLLQVPASTVTHLQPETEQRYDH